MRALTPNQKAKQAARGLHGRRLGALPALALLVTAGWSGGAAGADFTFTVPVNLQQLITTGIPRLFGATLECCVYNAVGEGQLLQQCDKQWVNINNVSGSGTNTYTISFDAPADVQPHRFVRYSCRLRAREIEREGWPPEEKSFIVTDSFDPTSVAVARFVRPGSNPQTGSQPLPGQGD